MKILTTVFAALLFIAMSFKAQAQSSVHEKAVEKTEKLAKVIDMTDEEKTLIIRQNHELINNAERLRKMEASDDEKQRMTEAYEQRYNAAIKDILGDERYAKFLEVSAKNQDKAKARAVK